MTPCKILSLLANRQIKLIFWKWEMSKRKKKKCLVKVQTSVKRRVYVCVSLCLHTGSHVKRISRPWSNKVPSHSQSTMKGRSHSISALCPAQKKERQTRGVGEKRREEKINGKCQGFFCAKHPVYKKKKKKINPMPFFLRTKPKQTLKWH